MALKMNSSNCLYGERASGRGHGDVPTAPEVVRYMLDLIGYTADQDLSNTIILEPSCGEGEFIVESTPITVSDNEILKIFDEDDIKVIHTPFHTKGSVCYYFINNKLLFSGDTLFKMSVGRDDLPGAIPSKRRESLEKIKSLPIETKIYPGHGPNTVLKTEIEFNHFLRY